MKIIGSFSFLAQLEHDIVGNCSIVWSTSIVFSDTNGDIHPVDPISSPDEDQQYVNSQIEGSRSTSKGLHHVISERKKNGESFAVKTCCQSTQEVFALKSVAVLELLLSLSYRFENLASENI